MASRSSGESELRPDVWLWVVVSAIAVALVAVQTPLTTALYGVPVAAAFALTVLHAAALPLALIRPAFAGALSVVAGIALLWLSVPAPHAPWPWGVATEITQLLTVLLLALRARWQIASATLGAALVGSVAVSLVHGADYAEEAAINIIVFVSIGAGVLGVGIAVRQWRRIRTQLVRERSLTASELSRRVVAEEKARLARELHDVIAHSMSVINVQATSAPARLGGVEPRTAEEFADIAAQARTALREMRGLLGALRDDESPVPVEPQRGLADIGVLVRQTSQAGAPVRLEWTGPEAPRLTALADLAAYRVVQEALSNALRHAPGAATVVSVDVDGDGIRLSVRNSRAVSPATEVSGGGHGLAAMRERVASAGGTVHALPTADEGFEVVASFTLAEEETKA